MSNRANGDQIVAEVFFQGLLRRIVGKREERVVLPRGSRMGDLVGVLAREHGEGFSRALLTPSGELRPDVGILVDGRNPARRGGLAYPLGGEDACRVEIALLGSPPVGG